MSRTHLVSRVEAQYLKVRILYLMWFIDTKEGFKELLKISVTPAILVFLVLTQGAGEMFTAKGAYWYSMAFLNIVLLGITCVAMAGTFMLTHILIVVNLYPLENEENTEYVS